MGQLSGHSEIVTDDRANTWRPPIVITLGVSLALLSLQPAQGATADVTVEFATRYGVVNETGLLVAPSPVYSPVATSLLNNLQPAFTRNTDLTSLALSQDAGVQQYEIVASEQWGYPSNDYYGREPPWADYTAYDATMTAFAASIGSTPVSWDVWNEPDLSNTWYGTEDQFFTTYLHTYNDLRAASATNPIGGPSISQFNLAYIQGLLDFCVVNGCEVNFVSWHELASTPTDISQIVAHAAAVRSLIASNPDYAALNIQQLQVNESVGYTDQYNPAENLAYLDYLEIANIDAAARSCWPAYDGTLNCYNQTLEGLLTETTQLPRSVWWVYRLHAGMTNRVALTSSSPQVVGIAATWPDGHHATRVLLGNYLYPGATSPESITLTLNHISQSNEVGDSAVNVFVQSIPSWTGEAPYTTLPIIYQVNVPVVNDQVVVALPPLALHNVYCVTVASPLLAASTVLPVPP